MGADGFFRCALAVAAGGVGFACASTQQITLECVPDAAVVYLDGERLEGPPPTVDLRSDRPHTLYFKGPGMVPELVVVNSEKVGRKSTLSPSHVCVKPRYVQAGRELEMEIDPGVSSEPPPGEADIDDTIEVEPRPDFTPEAP